MQGLHRKTKHQRDGKRHHCTYTAVHIHQSKGQGYMLAKVARTMDTCRYLNRTPKARQLLQGNKQYGQCTRGNVGHKEV